MEVKDRLIDAFLNDFDNKAVEVAGVLAKEMVRRTSTETLEFEFHLLKGTGKVAKVPNTELKFDIDKDTPQVLIDYQTALFSEDLGYLGEDEEASEQFNVDVNRFQKAIYKELQTTHHDAISKKLREIVFPNIPEEDIMSIHPIAKTLYETVDIVPSNAYVNASRFGILYEKTPKPIGVHTKIPTQVCTAMIHDWQEVNTVGDFMPTSEDAFELLKDEPEFKDVQSVKNTGQFMFDVHIRLFADYSLISMPDKQDESDKQLGGNSEIHEKVKKMNKTIGRD